MTKKLEQIQKENRKVVNTRYGLDKICWACEADGEIWNDDEGWVDCVVCNNGIVLNQVLFAIGEDVVVSARGAFYINDLTPCSDSIDASGAITHWDLTKKTLEEQSGETQRAIHKLLCKQ